MMPPSPFNGGAGLFGSVRAENHDRGVAVGDEFAGRIDHSTFRRRDRPAAMHDAPFGSYLANARGHWPRPCYSLNSIVVCPTPAGSVVRTARPMAEIQHRRREGGVTVPPGL